MYHGHVEVLKISVLNTLKINGGNKMTDLEKTLLNERELAKIYLQEFLQKKLTKKRFLEVLTRLYKNTDSMAILEDLK